MISATPSLVLRSLKYGETSLISIQFTRLFGVQHYLLKGVRKMSAKGKSTQAGLLQPGQILELVAYHRPQGNLQNLKEFSPGFFYQSLHEEVVKNSIMLFSAELLQSLLPESVPMQELFDFSIAYLRELDCRPLSEVANFPLFFALRCGQALGFELAGRYGPASPFLSMEAGAFVAELPPEGPSLSGEDGAAFDRLMQIREIESLPGLLLNAATRHRLLEWYLEFLQRHTGHMRRLKSLEVLQVILH